MGKLELFIINILATFRAVASKIISVEKKIDDLEIGGRNLIRSTGRNIDITCNSISREYLLTDLTEKNVVKIEAPFKGCALNPIEKLSEEIVIGQVYTLSFLVRYEGDLGSLDLYFSPLHGYEAVKETLHTEKYSIVSKTFIARSSSHRIHLRYTGTGFLYVSPKYKLEEANRTTPWSPAFEDLKTDWKENDEEAYSFLKGKPTHLSEFTNDLDHYIKAQTFSRNEALDKFIPKVGVVDIFDTKTFKSSPIVPNGTVAKHAVNLEQLQALKPHIGSNGNWFIGTNDTGINATGNKGEKGDTGARGLPGLPGEKGDKGDTGARGATGSKGDRGNDGLIPYVGNNGNWWIGVEDMGIPATGEKGEKGDTGARGTQGLPGEKGEKGDTGTRGTQGLPGDKGEKGDTGARGTQGLPGEKGEKGDTGARGIQGLPGEKGEKGDTGARGTQGLPGEKGEKGNTGTRGIQGLPGEDGAKGDKGDRGERGLRGLPGDPASSTDTLDNVAQRNNRTTKPLIVEDEKQRTEQHPRSFHFYDKDGLIGQINAARDGAQGKSLSLSYDQYLRFRLREETTQLAGGYFLSRVSGHDALNATDFTTLRQLRSHNPEIVDTPEYSLVQKKDLIIATKESTVLTIPDIHPSEQEDWNGRRFKIVAHGQVKLTKPYKELSGKGESTNIEAGQSVELMFLNQQWYAI